MKIKDILSKEELRHLEYYSEIIVNMSEYNTWKGKVYESLTILPCMVYRDKESNVLGYYLHNSIINILKYDSVMNVLNVKINHIRDNDYYISFPDYEDLQIIESIFFRYIDKIDYKHVSSDDILKAYNDLKNNK